jgi:hypothetical protein
VRPDRSPGRPERPAFTDDECRFPKSQRKYPMLKSALTASPALPTRRAALANIARVAAVIVPPASVAASAFASGELSSLIEAHRAARIAFGVEVDALEAARPDDRRPRGHWAHSLRPPSRDAERRLDRCRTRGRRRDRFCGVGLQENLRRQRLRRPSKRRGRLPRSPRPRRKRTRNPPLIAVNRSSATMASC